MTTVDTPTNGPAPQQPTEPTPPTPPANGSKPAFSLDDLEREGGVPEPFQFTLGGHLYTMLPRDEIPWQDLLMAMRSPLLFIRFVMSKEDYERFGLETVPMWKLDALLKRYLDHFGIDPGEFPGSSGF